MSLPKDIKDKKAQSYIDAGQDKTAVRTSVMGSLVSVDYDTFDTTYYTGGNGDGQIETVVYKLSGSTVLTVTMTYDTSGRLSSVSSI